MVEMQVNSGLGTLDLIHKQWAGKVPVLVLVEVDRWSGLGPTDLTDLTFFNRKRELDWYMSLFYLVSRVLCQQ